MYVKPPKPLGRLQKFEKWLLTKTAQLVAVGIVTTAGLSVFSLYYWPNTVYIDTYKSILRLHINGMSVPLPELLRTRVEKAVDLVEINENERRLFRGFTAPGFETFHAGTSYSRYGVIIGIPRNFTYTDIDSIDKSSIKVKNKLIPWDSQEASQLLDSLILSENAQLYAIAREVKTADTLKLTYDTFSASFAIVLCYSFSNYFNTKYNLYRRPRSIRIMLYCLVTGLTLGTYFLAKDFVQIHYEEYVDRFLKEKNPIFAEGGREYYEKALQRDRALRKLSGKEDESQDNASGIKSILFRQKHLPLEHRKEFFEGKVLN